MAADDIADAPLADGYRIEVFGETDLVTADDVVALWTGEGVVRPAEARRRIGEVHLVGVDATGALAGVTTAYLQRCDQLRMDMWFYRAFTSAAHRFSNIAVQLTDAGRQHLEDRFTSGEDRRAAGIVFEVENPGLRKAFPDALWLPLHFWFIGEQPGGEHVRVRYFPGATVPVPAG